MPKIQKTILSIITMGILSIISFTFTANLSNAAVGNYEKYLPTNDAQFKYTSFDTPYGVAVGINNYVYVADSTNNRIAKFNSAGDFLMDWGTGGGDTGNFFSPRGITTDKYGNVIVADIDNFRIQKFNSNGVFIRTWGIMGTGDGEFGIMGGLATDNNGNIYVAEIDNNRVQKFNSNGVYMMKFGTPGTGDGEFNGPEGLTVDNSGNIYVVDTNNQRIQKFNSAGVYQMQWGTDGSENGQFSFPSDITIDQNGDLLVTNTTNIRIDKFTTSGVYISTFGGYGEGYGGFYAPEGIDVDSNGNIYIADPFHYRVQKFNSNDEFVLMLGNTSPTRFDLFNRPSGIAFDTSNNLYVMNNNSGVVQKFNTSGIYQSQWGSYGSGDAQFATPYGFAIDSNNNVFVSDTGNHRIQKLTLSGTKLSEWGSYGAGDGQFKVPFGITVDNAGNVYVADRDNLRVQKFTNNGVFIAKFGTYGDADGQFREPTAVAVDSNGNIFVVDAANNNISKFGSNYAFISKFGQSGPSYTDYGLQAPHGIAIDSNNNVYVVDTYHNMIRTFTNNGVFISALGGLGSGSNKFNIPLGIAINGNNDVFIADTNNQRIATTLLKYQVITNPNISIVNSADGKQINSGAINGARGTDIPLYLLKDNYVVSEVATDLTTDRDWSLVSVDVDSITGKSVIANLNVTDAPGASSTHSLYLPRLANSTGIHICPDATDITGVSAGCIGGYDLLNSDPTVSIVFIDGQEYWKIDGMTGTGGMNKALNSVELSLTPNFSAISIEKEVVMSYTSAAGFTNGEKVRITWENGAGLSLANTCATPTTDSNGVGVGGAGSASILNGNVYVYTFAETTDDSPSYFCVNVTAYTLPGSYSVSLSDDNGSFTSTLYFVGNDNQVNVIANISPSLSFNIRTLDDATDTNSCTFGTVSTATNIPNYDNVIDAGSGECGYGLAIGTNAAHGFVIQIESDGKFRSNSTEIIDVSNGGTWTAGIEAYGLTNITTAQTGRNSGTGNYDQSLLRVGNYNLLTDTATYIDQTPTNFISYSDGIEYKADIDALDITQIIHGLVVGSGTPAGYYNQVITYTVTGNY